MCHYFYPELGAPSARLKEMSDSWIRAGHKVTVVTNFPNHPTGIIYPGYIQKSFMEDMIDGIRVLRCKTYATPNSGIIKKTLSHLMFAFFAPLQTSKFVKDSDIIIISSPPLFSGIGTWILSKRIRCPYIIEVRDIWPAIFVELGILKNKLAIKILETLELFLYKQSIHVVTVTQSFADDIHKRGIHREKLSFIPNGVDLTRFSPGPKSELKLKEFHVKGKFVVLYLGTHGISQALSSIIDTANILKDENDVHFLFVGEGADKMKIISKAEDLNLKNVSFFSGQAKDQVLEIYRCADVCLVPLKNIPLFKTFIPSKMFEVMATGIPLIAAVEGEARKILQRSEGGAILVQPENSVELAEKILHLKNNPEIKNEMTQKGRIFVEKEFNRELLAEKYLQIINMVLKP